MNSEAAFDYVIVGGGASGSVLARELADRSDATILLIEAGPSDEDRPEILDPTRYREVIEGPLSQHLVTLRRHARPAPVAFPIARVLGGCTSHNSCIWFRPPASDFEEWEWLGAAGWGSEVMVRLFEAVERRVAINTIPPSTDAQRALVRAASEAGFDAADFGRTHGDGVGPYRLNARGWLRQSASVAFLHPLNTLPGNLAVWTDTAAQRLIFDSSGRVVAVDTVIGRVQARREVILCAGAFGTPKLLLLSGLGPAEDSRRLGLPVVRHLPGVGRHLLDHPAAAVNWRAKRRPERSARWAYAGVVFATVEAGAPWPDIEIQLGPEPYNDYVAAAGCETDSDGFCAYLTVNRARSEGTVRLASPEPDAALVIDANHFGDAYDMRVMIGGIRLARRIFAGAALESWIGPELAPGADCHSDADLAAFVAATHTTGYHPAGTCRMGSDHLEASVVGPDLRVRGVPNLRIADASVLPAMVSVNIQATCMAIGMGCAEQILRDR